MVSYLGSLVQSCYGEGGRCRQLSLCVGSTHRVPATLGLPRSRVCALPIYTTQAPGCSTWSVSCVKCGSSFRVLHKSVDSAAPAFCAFPGLSGSGSQELDGGTLPGCSAPFSLCGPSLSFCAPSGASSLCLFLGAAVDVDHPDSQEFFG